jgi:small nuclear ribonucleoprotein E
MTLALLRAEANTLHRPRRAERCAFPRTCRSRLPDSDVHAVLLPPINFIFKLLQQRATVSIWLYENLGMRIEGKLRVGRRAAPKARHGADSSQGFDEFMNLVIDDAVEVTLAKKESSEERRKLGECIGLSAMRQNEHG